MKSKAFLPILAICVLILVALALDARGKNRQPFDGIYVREGLRSEFYEGIKDCPVHGSPYLLIPSSDFEIRSPFIPGDDPVRNLLQKKLWRAKFLGDLSRLGQYDYWEKRYWREIRVVEVFELEPLNCQPVQ